MERGKDGTARLAVREFVANFLNEGRKGLDEDSTGTENVEFSTIGDFLDSMKNIRVDRVIGESALEDLEQIAQVLERTLGYSIKNKRKLALERILSNVKRFLVDSSGNKVKPNLVIREGTKDILDPKFGDYFGKLANERLVLLRNKEPGGESKDLLKTGSHIQLLEDPYMPSVTKEENKKPEFSIPGIVLANGKEYRYGFFNRTTELLSGLGEAGISLVNKFKNIKEQCDKRNWTNNHAILFPVVEAKFDDEICRAIPIDNLKNSYVRIATSHLSPISVSQYIAEISKKDSELSNLENLPIHIDATMYIQLSDSDDFAFQVYVPDDFEYPDDDE